MPGKRISEAKKRLVIERAKGFCEYCKTPRKYSPQPFVIEHIIPVAQKGSNAENNLALACGGCNGHKYTKTEALDPVTADSVPLFHPRKDKWDTHFEWDTEYLQIIGITPVGRATVRALNLNRKELVNLREALKLAKKHPPVKN